MNYIVYLIAGVGAGIVTGLAGLSAAVVITPLLAGVCGWDSYDAVTVALAADVLASMLTANTYRKNRNIDLKRGLMIGFTALLGTIVGSFCGYLFNQAQPGGLGLLAMLTTVFLGLKFLTRPVTGGVGSDDASAGTIDNRKTALAMVCGLGIGWVCGFTGSGGGVLMLTVFTILLGYNLKVAVGTSTMIMTLVAFVGAVSHIAMGAVIHPVPMALIVLICLLSAWLSARFANRCEITKLNRVIGVVLLILGAFTMITKYVL
ncbi:MAG: sulfite exporter TauE/SafE family protein [Lachnospiraceae bacterium]|nr:sulfite exporter TauE/SafE family protein [Lachnospiraceae bacterium]